MVKNMLFDINKNRICDYKYLHVEKEQLNCDTYCCPRCYKIAQGDDTNLLKKAKKCRCKPWFEDGITKITKESYKSGYKRVIDNLGRISKTLQELDFAVTSADVIKNKNVSIYIYTEGQMPLGYIAVKPYGDTYLVTDFMVVEYKQRQGIGYKLFEYMLKDLNTSPDPMVYDFPSRPSRKFLNKYYGMEELFVLK